MAELEFKHHVSQIPEAQSIPEPTKRQVGAEVTHVPDFQGAYQNFAASTNWMSNIGSQVAARASNELAARLGSDVGKNPQGDLGPSLTEFDKGFEKAYTTQAQARLGLQAQLLISKSNVDLAAMPRLDENTIIKAQQQIYKGLTNIFSNAPSSIRGSLQHQYGSLMIQQNEQLTGRMLREQKEDRIDSTNESLKLSSQNAYSLSLSGSDLDSNGDSKSALEAVRNVQEVANSAYQMKDISKQERDVAVDTAVQSYLSGKYIRLALEAQKENKLGEFTKDLADNPPKDITSKNHAAVYNNVIGYINNQKALRADYENLKSQEMHNRIATDPIKITGTDWAAFENEVGPLKAEQMQFNLIQALKSKHKDDLKMTSLIKNWSDGRAHAEVGPEVQNKSFQKIVQNLMSADPSLSLEDAEVQAAASSGAEVNVFTKTLKNNLWSGDPVKMDSAVLQIEQLKSTHQGHALTGLNQDDLAIAAEYKDTRNPNDPNKAARQVIENHQNLNSDVKKVIDTNWQTNIDVNTRQSKTNVDDWILKKFGFKQSHIFSMNKEFVSPFMGTVYAADILNKYKSNYYATRGNDKLATQMTQEEVDANYGITLINGKPQWTLSPIERTLGFKANEGVASIHKDMIRQIGVQFEISKKAYEDYITNEYYTIESAKEKGGALRITKHERAEVGTKTKSYDLVLIGSNFNTWDVNIQTDHGPMNLFLEAPQLETMTYIPDNTWIKNDYMGRSQSFPNERYGQMIKTQLPQMDVSANG